MEILAGRRMLPTRCHKLLLESAVSHIFGPLEHPQGGMLPARCHKLLLESAVSHTLCPLKHPHISEGSGG